MPIIHLKIYEARLTDEAEPKLIADFTQVLVDNFGEGIREHTTVILEGVKPSRWGVAGKKL
jgi:4-oxalocrotonate tautomerase family enzyme